MPQEALSIRDKRDRDVLRHVSGDYDLRSPGSVKAMLARIGIDVPDTRSWRLEHFRGAHPALDALLSWRKAERIATTYGYDWLDRNVGPDDRLRGAWTGSDGAAGRMTASAGLHNLPAELRAAVAAGPGQVFVRADLGQIEPRVLAAVSGDRGLAAASADADLYAPVAVPAAGRTAGGQDRGTGCDVWANVRHGRGRAEEHGVGLPDRDAVSEAGLRVGPGRRRGPDLRWPAGPDVADAARSGAGGRTGRPWPPAADTPATR